MKLIAFFAWLASAVPAAAQDNTAYNYDALERVTTITVARPQGTVRTNIGYDSAGNRNTYTVIDSTGNSSDTGVGASASVAQRLVVVPLNGLTVIPIR